MVDMTADHGGLACVGTTSAPSDIQKDLGLGRL